MSKRISIFRTFAVATIFCVGASTAFAATPDDQINYWTFDEGTGRSVNDSVGGQNGVLTGSSTGFGWAGGKVGTALGMDGGAGESVALPNGILSGTQGSIALWFKLNNLSERNILFSGKSIADNNIYVTLSVDREGRPQVQFRDTSTGSDRKVQGSKILNTNEWYNLVLTANAQTYRMYVNNEDVSVAGDNTGRWFSDMTNHTLMYRIGALDASPLSGVFDGYIDDIRIYNRVLDVDDVASLYAKGNLSGPTVPSAIRPELSFTTTTTHIPVGGSVLLTWSTKNVTSCTASGSWNGSVDLSGERTMVKLGGDATYTITCSGKGGSVSESVQVVVGGADVVKPAETSASTTVTETVITLPAHSVSSGSSREETIKKLIEQIMLLIAELQKQLEILKAGAR